MLRDRLPISVNNTGKLAGGSQAAIQQHSHIPHGLLIFLGDQLEHMCVPASETNNFGTLLINIYRFKLSSSGMNIRKVNTDIEFLDIPSNRQGSVQLEVLELRHALNVVQDPGDIFGLEVIEVHTKLTNEVDVHSSDEAFAQDKFRLTDC